MGTSSIPPGLYNSSPAWLSAFEDITTIQFNHRILAYFLFALLHIYALLVWRAGLSARAKVAVALLLAALWLQVVLGVSTLLLHVPVWLAASHQAGAVLLLSASLYCAHVLRRQGGQALQRPTRN
jgi:cytochrome c oxidase assembly protein subunit 15